MLVPRIYLRSAQPARRTDQPQEAAHHRARRDGPPPTAPLESLEQLEELSFAESSSIEDAVPIGKIKTLRKLVLEGAGMANRNSLQQPGLVID